MSTNGAGGGITFQLDGREVDARTGETILQAARRHGVDIPHLCYTDGMRPDGNCRACMVEIEGERVLAPSCARAPTAGMKVSSVGERALHSQRMVLELLLSDSPEEPYTPGSELSHWAERLGVTQPRFAPTAAAIGPVFGPDFSHPAIGVRLDACIQCTRCVRACREVQVNDVIGYAGRGAGARIVFDLEDAMGVSTCVACGECVQACPTGALLAAGGTDAAIPRHGDAARDGVTGGGKRETSSPERHAAKTGTPHVDQQGTAPAEQPRGLAASPRRRVATSDNGAAGRSRKAPAPPLPVVEAAEREVDTLCPYCGVGCQLTYHVRDDRIVRATGRDGPANRGRLCVKGRFGFDYSRSPQRLTVPLVRRDGVPKDATKLVDPGDPWDVFREATWDEALDRAAAGLRRIRDDHGGEALAGFGSAKGSNEEAYLFQKLVRAGFGTNNVDHCTRLCHASSVAALLEGIGSGAVSNPFGDVEYADVIFVIGSNATANHPVAATFMKNAVERGAKLIHADPRRLEISRFATHFMQFKPGTDVALLNAMMHVIITEGLTDDDFIARRTEGFDELKRRMAAYGPELMEPLCGVPAETVRQAARLYATSKGSMIFWGMGISQHTHGTDNARALIALALMTGQIGRRGTGLHPLRGQNNVQGASDVGLIPMVYPDYQNVGDPEVRRRFEDLWGAELDPEPGLTVVEIMHAIRDGQICGMYIMGENPAMSDPDVQHAREALAALEHLVVQDIFLTETASFADVVLPASVAAEKTGTFTNTDRRVQLGRKALELPGQARQDLELIQEIARRIGLDWDYAGPADVWEEIRQAAPSVYGITWERLERDGAVTYPCRQIGDPGTEVLFDESFPTPSGRGRFVPADFTPPDEVPDDDFPNVLITGRLLEHWHTGAMTRRADVLDALEPVPTAAVNSAMLERLELEPGDVLTLETRRGLLSALARRDDGVPDGAVFVPFCYVEAAANLLTNPALDPWGKIPEFKYCAVRLTPGGPPLHPAGYGHLDALAQSGD